MLRSSTHIALTIVLALAGSACGAAPSPSVAPEPAPEPDTRQSIHTDADVAFMTNMIGHHAQAVRIAGWAPTHGASPAVLRLAERIVVGQQDEIALMQQWLRERGETVPTVDSSHHRPGMDHSAHMAGMLSPAQLDSLDTAQGEAFDRLFLEFMIQHHEGAVAMVQQLFASQGAGEEDTVFRLASDVQADQITEIHRMQQMIDQLPTTTD